MQLKHIARMMEKERCPLCQNKMTIMLAKVDGSHKYVSQCEKERDHVFDLRIQLVQLKREVEPIPNA